MKIPAVTLALALSAPVQAQLKDDFNAANGTSSTDPATRARRAGASAPSPSKTRLETMTCGQCGEPRATPVSGTELISFIP